MTYLLSERFCQDPVEAFFGKQIYKGRRSDNPSAKEFLDNTEQLTSTWTGCSRLEDGVGHAGMLEVQQHQGAGFPETYSTGVIQSTSIVYTLVQQCDHTESVHVTATILRSKPEVCLSC